MGMFNVNIGSDYYFTGFITGPTQTACQKFVSLTPVYFHSSFISHKCSYHYFMFSFINIKQIYLLKYSIVVNEINDYTMKTWHTATNYSDVGH